MSTLFTAPELVAVGQALFKMTGKFPARDDFRLYNRAHLTSLLGATAPGTHDFTREFGSWSAYLDVCGITPEGGGRPLQVIERAAANHCVKVLGVTEETAERSITDGWYPDGRTVEIKGSVLRQHASNGHHFFGFKLHGRQMSVSCDELILVGLSRDHQPIARLQIPKAAMPSSVDGKGNVVVYATSLWGTGDSQYRRYVRWLERSESGLPGAISAWSAGKASDRT